MTVEIDTRSIWVVLAVRALRLFFFLALAAGFYYLVTMPAPEGLVR